MRILVGKFAFLVCSALVALVLVGCGKSSGDASTLNMASSSVATSSVAATVTLSGLLTYDYVPHVAGHSGLNYAATLARPIRGAVVELLGTADTVLATTQSSDTGVYSFAVKKNTSVKVRVKAQLSKADSPSWNFKVTDNTQNNALYVMDGALASSGSADSQRNLHAASGWTGTNYGATRTAAPFAILDDIYLGVKRLLAAGNTKNFPALELRWSIKNNNADARVIDGDIGTTFFDGTAIYILGDANSDTDEYDPHVILHEWGHYIESTLFRSDNIGGDHSMSKYLDYRVAMSEGFCNAFSAMMLDDAIYVDSNGASQSLGIVLDIGDRNLNALFFGRAQNNGSFSERSVGSIFYNYYSSANSTKMAKDFSPIFQVLSSPLFTSNNAMISIYVFLDTLKKVRSEQTVAFSSLLTEQNILGADAFGVDEKTQAGSNYVLPVYKTLNISGSPLNICSSSTFGMFNKLINSQFVIFDVTLAGNYNFSLQKNGGDTLLSKPEFIVYHQGTNVLSVPNKVNNSATGSVFLAGGSYVVEIYDANFHDANSTLVATSCFDLNITPN